MVPNIAALRQKAQLNLLKKQQDAQALFYEVLAQLKA